MLLARLIERVPELEAAPQAAQEPQEGQERVPEGQTTGQTPPAAEGPEARPWWRRIFGS